MKHVIPLMDRQGGGSIINISSVASIRYSGIPYATYYATKAALNHLTRTTAAEYAHKRIRVNAILPGLMKTSFGDWRPGSAPLMLVSVRTRCSALTTARILTSRGVTSTTVAGSRINLALGRSPAGPSICPNCPSACRLCSRPRSLPAPSA
jgi:NAD(P)-dependent dehydrogenase (short-subunit alcohol dehydrogenase family)